MDPGIQIQWENLHLVGQGRAAYRWSPMVELCRVQQLTVVSSIDRV